MRLAPAQVDALRRALSAAGYTVDAVTELVGVQAHRALARNQTTPALRRTTGGTVLETMVRLWPLQAAVDSVAAERALPGLVEPLCAVGLLERSGAEVRARVDVRPYADDEHDWWVVSDLTPGLDGQRPRVDADHVLGVSSASESLAALTVRHQVGSALDLGTGCGVQALHLSSHARRVVATDVNPRALAMARLTADLNVVDVDVRSGSLFDPVVGERFDLVVTNPPFVISPAGTERLVYRDSGLPGDDVVRRIVTGAPQVLAQDGWCQLLANWAHVAGQPWQERVESWVQGTGCDAWVLQRELLDPCEYVELWLADAGLLGRPDYAPRYDAWLGWFEREHIEAVGMGWVCMRRTTAQPPTVRAEEWPFEVEQPLGPAVAAWGRRTRWLQNRSDDLDATRLRVANGVQQEAVGAPGAKDPAYLLLRQQHGLRRATRVDTVEAGLVGACEGDLTVGQILDALAQLLGEDPAALRARYLPRVHDLVADGILEPAG